MYNTYGLAFAKFSVKNEVHIIKVQVKLARQRGQLSARYQWKTKGNLLRIIHAEINGAE